MKINAGFVKFEKGSNDIYPLPTLAIGFLFPQVGASFAIFGYIVIVLGGLGSLKGAIVGGLLLGIVTSLTGVFFNPAFKYIAVFLAYLVVVVIKPEGLGGK